MHAEPPTRPLPDYATALALALDACPAPAAESVPLAEARDRVLAESARADRDLPPFPRATMDGYAVRAAEIGAHDAFEVVGEVPAGSSADPDLPPGSVVRIATGARVPTAADAVIPHEQSDRGEPVRFTISDLAAWANVHRQGEDAEAEAEVVAAGTRLGAHHLGILGSVGWTRVRVFRLPRVAVLTTGDEVRPIGAAIEPWQIRNSNRPMLVAAIRDLGGRIGIVHHMADVEEETLAALAAAIADSDLIVTAGGISAGERDLVARVLDRLGVRTLLHGAMIQPGKPIYVGIRDEGPGGRPVIALGLPGNPVSALVTAHLFVRPMLRAMTGRAGGSAWRAMRLAAAVRPNRRRQAFRPARLVSGEARTPSVPKMDSGPLPAEAGPRVEVIPWRGSGDLVHTATSDGMVALPASDDEILPGTMVPFLPWSD